MRYKLYFLLLISIVVSCALLFGWRDLFDRGRYFSSVFFDVERLVIGSEKYSSKSAALGAGVSCRNLDLAIVGDSHVDRIPLGLFGGRVGNYGISGDTSRGLINRSKNIVSCNKIDRVLVLIGYNDLKYREPVLVVKNISDFLNVLEGSGVPLSQVYVHELFPVEAGRWFIHKRRELFNAMMSEACLIRGCQWLKLDGHFADDEGWLRSDFSTDGVHLNDTGYSLFGSNVCRKMKAAEAIC